MGLKEIQEHYHPGKLLTIDFATMSKAVKDVQQLLRLIDAHEEIEDAARYAPAHMQGNPHIPRENLKKALTAIEHLRLELWGEDVTGITDEPKPLGELPLLGDAVCCSDCGYAGYIGDNEGDHDHTCGHASEPHWSI